MTGLPDNNGNDFIRGLATNPCINGITKTDALEIKKIPELDERVTALENGGSSTSEWIKYTSENTVNDILDLVNFKAIKDIKICFISEESGCSWIGTVEKNTSLIYLKLSNLEFYCFPNDNSSIGNYFYSGLQFPDSVFENLSFFDVSSYPLKGYKLTIDSTNISKVTWSSIYYYYDNENQNNYITIYYRN